MADPRSFKKPISRAEVKRTGLSSDGPDFNHLQEFVGPVAVSIAGQSVVAGMQKP